MLSRFRVLAKVKKKKKKKGERRKREITTTGFHGFTIILESCRFQNNGVNDKIVIPDKQYTQNIKINLGKYPGNGGKAEKTKNLYSRTFSACSHHTFHI